MTKSKIEPQAFNFESTLAELNQLVEQMEHGNLSLEDSLKNFERGTILAKQCQEALKNAEQKVQILIEKNGTATLTPFTEET